MKKIKIIAVITIALIGFTNLQAQSTINEPVTSTKTSEKPILTADQKTMLQKQKELMHANKKLFKKSFTPEQLAILENKELDRKAKRTALSATFTDEQKKIIKENHKKAKALREDFKKTLTDEQREQLRAHIDGKGRRLRKQHLMECKKKEENKN